MKKTICFFLVSLLLVSGGYAQGVADMLENQASTGDAGEAVSVIPAETVNLRKKYFRLSYSSTKMQPDGNSGNDLETKSKYGAALTVGKSFYLHKKPIANMLYIGLDATWLDLNYTYYSYNMGTLVGDLWNYRIDDYYDYEMTDHQADIAMQIGPSFHVYPVGKMHIEAYFRYAPTFSLLVEDGEFYGNYATYFVSGGAVSYHCIGLGVEARFGNCKYKTFGGDDESDSPSKTKFRGYRAFLSFRF